MNGITYTDTLTVMECGRCGISFAVPESWRRERKERGLGFYCPNGDERVYRETDVQRLTRELERERARVTAAQDQMEAAQRQASAARGQVTKIKNRIANGVCPECNRHFQNVEKHMKSQHGSLVDSVS